MNNYSEKEIELLKYFGISEHLLGDCCISAPALYRVAVEKAFCENMKGVEVESLRRCYNALQKCSIYRLTKEWDAMIEFKEGEYERKIGSNQKNCKS